MPVTLSQIAKRAGVSTMTVCRALSEQHKHRVSGSLREKIESIAHEMDYRPNVAARSLLHRKSFLLGVLFSRATLSLIPDISEGIQEVVAASGYAPVMYTDRDPREELRFVELCMDRRVDGLIINAALDIHDGSNNFDRLMQVRERGMPLVEINGQFIRNAPSLYVDFIGSGLSLTRGLIEAGHKRIVLYIHDQYRAAERVRGALWSSNDFYRGYTQAMQHAGLEPVVHTAPFAAVDPQRSLSDRMSISHEHASAVFRHASKPTAAVCYHEQFAASLCQVLPARQRERFEVGTYSNGREYFHLPGSVRRLCFPGATMGRAAATALFSLIQGHPVSSQALPAEPPDVARSTSYL